MMNISVLFEMRNAGGAAAAATSLSLYTVAGCVAGLVYGSIFKIAQRWCLALGYALCGIGALCVYVGTNSIVMTLGLMLIGFGFSVIMPTFMSWAGAVTPLSTIAMATSILLALMNLGGFVSSFWLKLLTMVAGENIFSAIIAEIAVFLATAVFFAFYNPFKQRKK